MSVGYYNSRGEQRVSTFGDIRPYLSGGAQSFASGGTVSAVILAEDVQDVRWVELMVQPTSASSVTLWNLESVSCMLGENGVTKTRVLTDSIPEGESRRIYFANIYVAGEVTSPISRDASAGGQTTTVQVSGGSAGVLVGSGEGVRVKVDVVGSRESFGAAVYSLDPQIGVTGQVNLSANYGYSTSYLDSLSSEARRVRDRSDATAAERAAARDLLEMLEQVKSSDGSFTTDSTGVTFMAPRNYGSGNLYYRIAVTSAETGETAFTVDVTVRSEEKSLDAAIQTMRDAVSYADTYVRVKTEETDKQE